MPSIFSARILRRIETNICFYILQAVVFFSKLFTYMGIIQNYQCRESKIGELLKYEYTPLTLETCNV